MGYLGDKGRSEVMRFRLTLDAAPTGTPTITITRGQGTALDTPISTANMTQGASTLEWYYDYTTEAAAQVGAYTAKYIAVIDGVNRYAYDQYDVTVNDADSIPTASEIDTELSGTHGVGSWLSSAVGNGAKAIIFNIKDGDTNNLEGVNISVHNAADDESPIYASGQTDTNGNSATFNLDAATYEVRLSKAGAIDSETETVVITGDATVNLTVVAQTVSNPSDPDVCRLRIYPITLGNADITDLADNLTISSLEALTKVEGQFISNTSSTFTYDSSTDPDSYYFDAVRGSVVFIKCDILGIDTSAGITVPDLSSKDLTDLIS
jgi:hypothetical protein